MAKSLIIPFFIPHAGCPFTCVYCNQWEISGESAVARPEEIRAKVGEYRNTRNDPATPIETAFYGGSFTGLTAEIQEDWLRSAYTLKKEGLISGIRLSTRPDYISKEVLQRLARYGVTTIELGVQSLDDEVLAKSCRGHSVDDTLQATRLIREYPFSLVYQLMLGLPGETALSARISAKKTVAAKPDGVRIYPTVVLKNTALAKWYEQGSYRPWTLQQAVEMGTEWLAVFSYYKIPVIRMGLQASANLTRSGDLLAGPYHPAYGELVKSSLMLKQIQQLLFQIRPELSGELLNISISFHPGDYSKVAGQKKRNIIRLKNTYRLRDIELRPDAEMKRDDIAITAAPKTYCLPRKEFLELYRIKD